MRIDEVRVLRHTEAAAAGTGHDAGKTPRRRGDRGRRNRVGRHYEV